MKITWPIFSFTRFKLPIYQLTQLPNSLSLQSQLDELTAKVRAMVPAERLTVVDRTAEEMVRSHLSEQALKVGDQAPPFELPDGDGMRWRSENILRGGPMIVLFYRGRWC